MEKTMFDFQEVLTDEYDWPVEVKVPVNGGKSKTIKFTAVFKRLKKTEANEMLESARKKDKDGKTLEIKFKPVFDEVLLNLKAKNNEGKIEILPDEIQEELLEIPGAESAIFWEYNASLSGERAKN